MVSTVSGEHRVYKVFRLMCDPVIRRWNVETKQQNQGLLIVVSAPSGAGKTSILSELFEKHPELIFSVSVTTRPPRKGEVDGVDYHFVTNDVFDRYVKNEAFAEWAVVHGERYGTLKEYVRKALDAGKTIILDTDTVGAFNIRGSFPDAILIFIAPPSPEELSERLRNRNTESDDIIERRLRAAPREMASMSKYDYIVLNNTICVAADNIHSIILAEKSRSGRIISTLTPWRDYINGT